jgi:hypothetical protein
MTLAVFEYEVYDKSFNIMEYFFTCPFGGLPLRCSFGGPESWLLMSEPDKKLLTLNATISCIYRSSNNIPTNEKTQMVEDITSG